MNKTKKELFEENKMLKEEKKLYEEFWEVDTIKKMKKEMNNTKIILYIISFILLVLAAFLTGMSMG